MISPFLRRYYARMQALHPEILWQGDPARRAVALTFDDGPHRRDTPRVLDVLARHGVRATFFLLGRCIPSHTGMLRQIHGCGHQLALHGYRHVPFPFEKRLTLQKQLAHTRQLIGAAAGIAEDRLRDVRPPYGIFDRRTLQHLTGQGYRLTMWNCMPPHWMQPVGWSIRQILEALVPGAVIVLHDGHGHGKRVAEILEAVLPRVQSLGYEFITVEEMQGSAKAL